MRRTKHLNQILNFGSKKIYFLYQFKPSSGNAQRIVPPISTEDFLAMNNFLSALIKINWRNETELVATEIFANQIENNKNNNIVTFGSSKINNITREIEKILAHNNLNFYRIEKSSTSDEWRIVDNDGRYNTSVYAEYQKYLMQDIEKSMIGRESFTDIAYITKVTNPRDSESKVIIIAGVKGIGTWGAAECIKKWSKKIYEKLPRNKKNRDFSALMRISYRNYDIVDVKVINIHLFEDRKLIIPNLSKF